VLAPPEAHQSLARLGRRFAGGAIAVPLLTHATRVEFAGGLSLKINPSISFYAQAGYSSLPRAKSAATA